MSLDNSLGTVTFIAVFLVLWAVKTAVWWKKRKEPPAFYVPKGKLKLVPPPGKVYVRVGGKEIMVDEAQLSEKPPEKV